MGSHTADHVDCDTQVKEKHKTNRFGWKIATYKSSTYWCWDGDEILGVPVFRTSGKVYFLGAPPLEVRWERIQGR